MSSFDFTSVGPSGTDAVTVTTADGVAVVKLSGELDMAMAPSARARLADVDGDVELDCSGLTFMDSAGIKLFVETYQACVGRGAKLTVVNAPRGVACLLALTGLDGLFDVRSADTVS